MLLPPADTPALICFLDETGVVAQDRFFAVGVLAVPEQSELTSRLKRYRRQYGWHAEWHFNRITEPSIRPYRALIDILDEHREWAFAITLADRMQFDVAAVVGDRFMAYERIAAQSLSASLQPDTQAVVLADEYSTPDSVHFEQDVRRVVNSHHGGNMIVAVTRVPSHSHDLLQVSDVLTSAITYPYRVVQPRANKRPSPKRRIAHYTAERIGDRLPISDFDPVWLTDRRAGGG